MTNFRSTPLGNHAAVSYLLLAIGCHLQSSPEQSLQREDPVEVDAAYTQEDPIPEAESLMESSVAVAAERSSSQAADMVEERRVGQQERCGVGRYVGDYISTPTVRTEAQIDWIPNVGGRALTPALFCAEENSVEARCGDGSPR